MEYSYGAMLTVSAMNTVRGFLYLASIHSLIYAAFMVTVTAYPSMAFYYSSYFLRTLIFLLTMQKFSRLVFNEFYLYVAIVNLIVFCASNIFFQLCDPEIDNEPFALLVSMQWVSFAEVLTLVINHLLLPCLVCQYLREQKTLLSELEQVKVTNIEKTRIRYLAVETISGLHNEQWSFVAFVWLVGVAFSACLEIGTFIKWIETEYVTKVEIASTVINQIGNLLFVETITATGTSISGKMKILRRRVMKNQLCTTRSLGETRLQCFEDRAAIRLRRQFEANFQSVPVLGMYIQLSTELSKRPIEFTFHGIITLRRSLTFTILVTLITYSLIVFQAPSMVEESEEETIDSNVRENELCEAVATWLN